MLFFQWRKRIHQKRRAKAWVKQLKAETYFQRALSHRMDKEALPGSEVQSYNPATHTIPKPHGNILSSEATTDNIGCSTSSLQDSDPYKPVFQELPCACALPYLPPLLEHSASFPCSSIPVSSTFSSFLIIQPFDKIALHKPVFKPRFVKIEHFHMSYHQR
uniref:Uncharacterized protein n=1 Tax=Anolis carolinensis TaxID=28377 RepID=A0A803T7P9_ANOCA